MSALGGPSLRKTLPGEQSPIGAVQGDHTQSWGHGSVAWHLVWMWGERLLEQRARGSVPSRGPPALPGVPSPSHSSPTLLAPLAPRSQGSQAHRCRVLGGGPVTTPPRAHRPFLQPLPTAPPRRTAESMVSSFKCKNKPSLSPAGNGQRAKDRGKNTEHVCDLNCPRTPANTGVCSLCLSCHQGVRRTRPPRAPLKGRS